MKLTLIKTESEVILVSDEPIEKYDTFIDRNYKLHTALGINELVWNKCKKVIALSQDSDLPQIVGLDTIVTHKGEGKTIAEWIGVWDVGKIGLDYCLRNGYTQFGEKAVAYQYGFEDGFNKALSLTKGKEFTEEDMKIAWKDGWITKNNETMPPSKHRKEFILSLRPNSWEVEVEMERVKNEVFISVIDAPYEQPKITNGTIKVTKIKL